MAGGIAVCRTSVVSSREESFQSLYFKVYSKHEAYKQLSHIEVPQDVLC